MTVHAIAHDASIALAIVIFAAFLTILLGRSLVRPDYRPSDGEAEGTGSGPDAAGVHNEGNGA